MNWNENQIWFDFWNNTQIDKVYFFQDIIIDRGSKYSVFASPVTSREEIKDIQKSLKRQEYFDKATHNSFAFRIQTESGILEGKNDDGEKGAGMCILRELERENAINMIVVITRYFWGIQLQSDRFKHVINGVKIFFEKIKK